MSNSRPTANPGKPVTLKPRTVGPKNVKTDSRKTTIDALVPNNMVGARPAPSTADRSNRRPLK
jgi:hypothetical protein